MPMIPEEFTFEGLDQILPTGFVKTVMEAAKPKAPSVWDVISQVAKSGSEFYKTYQQARDEKKLVKRLPPTPTMPMPMPELAPLAAEETPWTTYALIGGGILVAGVIVYLLLKS